jgi:hypothetical protein
MTTQNTETTIHTRQLTDAEKSKMRRVHWILIPAICIPIFIIWILSMTDAIPTPAKYAAYTIAIGVILVMVMKQFKLDNDVRNGEAEVIRGILEDKYKFGGNQKRNGSSIGVSKSSRNKSQATYILVFEGKKYWVRSKIYSKAEKGAHSEMVWLPNSQYVVSIRKI